MSSSHCLVFICIWFHAAVQAPYKHGDFMLGGLLSVRQLQEATEAQCGEIDMRGLGLAQAIIYAVEKINNDSNLLPNSSLGYDIRDYSENITKAAQISYEMFKDEVCSSVTPGNIKKKSIVALIGPFESRTALYIGGFLRMRNVSGISGTTTSAELSSTSYNHCYRTVPSDRFLAKAMIDMIEHFHWSYVGAVGLDDLYGRSGVWSLVNEATTRKSPFCIAITEFIRHDLQFPSIKFIVEELKRRENIKVVILWIYGGYLQRFIEEVNSQNLTNRVWLMSDIYAISKENEFLDSRFSILEGSIGFQHHDFNGYGFKERMETILTNERSNNALLEWSDIEDNRWNCSGLKQDYDKSKPKQYCKNVIDKIYSTYVPYTIDAVYSAAHALDILTKDLDRIDTNYLQHFDVNLYDMQQLLRRVNFTGLTGTIKFNEFGDIDSASYDIFSVHQVSSEASGLKNVLVGKWEKHADNEGRLIFREEIHWKTPTGRPPKSECSERCPPGTRKSATTPCCWQCIPCPGGSVSPNPGSESCVECSRGRISNHNKTECIALPSANVSYSTIGGTFILGFGTFGVVVTLFFCAVIGKFWNSPIVKSSKRELSLALLLTILSLLSLVFINVFEPTDAICKIIYPVRYLTYNLCLSLLLTKVWLISTAFQVPVVAGITISSLSYRKQIVIVIALQVALLFVLLPWLLLDPPFNIQHIHPELYTFTECKAYNMMVGKTLFLATCFYVFIQMVLSAYFAFKVRNIPENFSEAKRISFSLYIFLFSLLCYHPVELSMHGWYVTIVDCVTTLLSAYGFLCCIYFPKIYILLFRPELNTLGSIRQEVTQFSFGSRHVRVNPAFDSSTQQVQN